MCYTVPIVNAVAVKFWHAKTNDPRVGQLKIMFYGASIFGFVDHLWNGELFLISPNIGKDLFLGFVIMACVWGVWGAGLVAQSLQRRKATASVKA